MTSASKDGVTQARIGPSTLRSEMNETSATTRSGA
jgi:hypothetical protein